MKNTCRYAPLVVLLLSVAAISIAQEQRQAGQQQGAARQASAGATGGKPTDAAVERTRDTVKMLDEIYKQTIVLITDKYVQDESDFPAGSAAVELFGRIGKSGSHQARLLDVTGDPYDPDNVAKTDFEKEGVKQIKGGKGYYEQVQEKDGKPYLNAMTSVPVVMEKCVMCHPHYAEYKDGKAIGAISYEVPIR